MKRPVSVCVLALLLTSAAFPWSNHYLFNRPALEALPELSGAPKVKVEALEDFLLKEQEGLIALMAQIENDARLTYAKSAPQPEALTFKGGDAKTIRNNFLRALRVNTGTPLGYFLQALPGRPLAGKPSNPNTVSIFGEKDLKGVYSFYDVRKGDMVSPLEVVSTAGDEPDFGLDINLFSDNGEQFGKDYGFGTQSFGDAKLYYGTQAPFHIGYYHESGIIFMAAGFLKKTYPRYRVHQYTSLARFAFKTGHPYWGYRFLGWGLHYVADLTQPYHARVLPTYGTVGMLWINIKAMVGFDKAKTDAIDRISKRHTTIENYHRSMLARAYSQKNLQHPFILSMQRVEKDKTYAKFNDDYLVDVTSKESYSLSDKVDELIDQSNLLQSFSDGNQLPIQDSKSLEELNTTIIQLMEGAGAHLRNYVRAGIQ